MNLDQVMYPSVAYTGPEVIGYHAQVAETLLPHIADEPLADHNQNLVARSQPGQTAPTPGPGAPPQV